jgi:polysaccharide biosynthesis protein PslG
MSHKPRNLITLIVTLVMAASLVVLVAAASAHTQRKHHARVTCKRVRGRNHRKHLKCTRVQKHSRRPTHGREASVTVPINRADPKSAITGGLIVGLNANTAGWGGDSTQGRLEQVIDQTGTKWLREQFLWSTIEPTQGHFDFSYYDHYMLLASQDGEHILPLLFDTPSWGGSTWNTIPSDPSAYAQYVAAVVNRYGPHGSFWQQYPQLHSYAIQWFELWNEPYYSNGDNGAYNPARYANLVKAAVIAGRQADPNAKFLMAAEYTGQQVGSNWVSWVDALYNAVPDLNHYFDGVAIHPYGSDVTGLDQSDPWNQLRRAEMIHQEFLSHGATDKPFWITEVGWPTCSGVSAQCVTPQGQASNMRTLFGYLSGKWSSWVKATFLYHYEDLGTDSSDPENDYGLTTVNHQPKPALSVFDTRASTSAVL